MSQHSVPYGVERIRFTLRRPPDRRQRRVAIHVEPDGQVRVDAPVDATLDEVRAAVVKRARWIRSHVDAARKRHALALPREYVSGESLLYLGRRYRLKVIVNEGDAPGASMRGTFVEVRVRKRNAQAVREVLDEWYRERTRPFFEQRMQAIAAPLRWVRSPPPTRIQRMTRQWGNCSPAGRITLNLALMKAPRECIDYVLLHELCHLAQHHHGKDFYRLLDAHMPGWRPVKQRLDDLAEVLLVR